MLTHVVFAAVGVFYVMRIESERVETATLARSRILAKLMDVQLEQHLAALRTVRVPDRPSAQTAGHQGWLAIS